MHTVTHRKYLMVLGLFVGLAGLLFFQYASAQYYTKDESQNQGMQMAKNESEKTSQTMTESKAKMESMKQTKTNQPAPPLVQIAQGVASTDVQCRDGLQLVFKASNDMPACVRPATAQRLMDMGWAKQINMVSNVMPAQMVHKIDVTATEKDEVYRWSDSDGINPTLTVLANTENVIQVQNPTDAKHEFVIESDGEEVATSGDISADSSGMLTIKPNATGTWEYHCEYHPTTMKGTIQIVAP